MALRDKDKLDEVLLRFADEDPTLRVVLEDKQTGQTLIRGMGELHLDIIIDRLKREHKLEVRVGKPQVVYRETCMDSGEASEVFERESETEKIYGAATVSLSPAGRGSGNSVELDLGDTWATEEVLTELREGVLDSLRSGPVLGYEVDDVAVTISSIGEKQTASKPLGYRIAAAAAVRKALQAAKATLLHPRMAVEISVPSEFVGDVIGGLNARNGRIEEVRRGQTSVVMSTVNLEKMFGYATELRSNTQAEVPFHGLQGV